METMATASKNLTHVMLELGGNDAFILDKDGDLDLAVEEMVSDKSRFLANYSLTESLS